VNPLPVAPTVGVFCTGKLEGGLMNKKHKVMYPGSGPSLEVIALHPAE
jgi:hypothetical protein